MKIIPAIDIINGKCVRLTNGDYGTVKIYNEDPLEVAKTFQDYGISYLHLVDLDGARSGNIINYAILERIASETCLRIDFGGGIKSDEDVRVAFESGASQITAGSIAAENKNMFLQWLKKYGSEKIILGADCRNRNVSINGWNRDTDNDVIDFIKAYEELGVKHVIATDISKDGMLQGPAFDLYKEIIQTTKISVVASGGITNTSDIQALKEAGCAGTIIGKAIYEGKITLKELSDLC